MRFTSLELHVHLIRNGVCKYGDNCWYLHQQTNVDNKTMQNYLETNSDIIQKIFKDMEIMTGRISQLEVKN